MIEKVEELRPELKVKAFPNSKILQNSKVDVIIGRPLERVPPGIP
jgi:hypothetical protein